jgi:hypothetical protein
VIIFFGLPIIYRENMQEEWLFWQFTEKASVRNKGNVGEYL